MGLSKEKKIWILLVIDVAFFLLELTVGYAVHSLALVADSFHMLNDVISLLVGLWAVRVANQKTNSNIYTYGWQRAETLGALVNGVFLVALCLSIFLEAIQRFVEPQEVSYPKLVLIVGCFGLASNILGLFLFHDHGHSHGGHDHDEISNAEEGHAHGHTHDVDTHDHAPVSASAGANGKTKKDISWDVGTASEDASRDGNRTPRRSASGRRISKGSKSSKGHARSRSRGYSGIDNIYVHPSSFRQNIIEASRMDPDVSDSDSGAQTPSTEAEPSERSALLPKNKTPKTAETTPKKRDCHSGHKHNKPKTESSSGGHHGHSHGDLNMRGVFLHVLGDALGNVGVIASALFIWKTDFTWRFYADPLISLIITVIILLSAIPLCKAASRILLQAVPAHLDIEEIKTDIVDLDGIVSVHHLHVWQLTEKRLVASLHVQFGFGFSDQGSVQYMDLIKEIQKCLHAYGIHHATIQPEFCLNPDHDHSGASSADEARGSNGSRKGSGKNSKTGSVRGNNDCLLECTSGCGNSGNGCGGK